MKNSREKGTDAEDIAVDYLIKNGYRILERNWTHQHHELDIIAAKDGILIIVEVKSLATNQLRQPYEAVNNAKQRSMIVATNAYIRKHNIDDEVRFDIISIVLNRNGVQIEYIENAFYPKVR